MREKQTLVNNGSCGHGRHIEFFAVLEIQSLDFMTGELADNVEFSFQSIRHHDVSAAANKNLFNNRSSFTDGFRQLNVFIDGNVSPSQNHLAFSLNSSFDFLLARSAGRMFAGQEDHTDAIITGLGQKDILFCHFSPKELVGNLNKNTGPVT